MLPDTYNKTYDLLSVERKFFSPKQMAEARGIDPMTMRQRCRYYSITGEKYVNTGDELIAKLWHRGGHEEIAEYMGLTPEVFIAHLRRIGYLDDQGQLALWPAKKVHTMKIVHIAREKLTMPDTQISLFDPSNTGVINAADRFIAEASGNCMVQLLHAAR